jgi:hypothetical protein
MDFDLIQTCTNYIIFRGIVGAGLTKSHELIVVISLHLFFFFKKKKRKKERKKGMNKLALSFSSPFTSQNYH